MPDRTHLARLLRDPVFGPELRGELTPDESGGSRDRALSGRWSTADRAIVLSAIDADPAALAGLSETVIQELQLFLRPALIVQRDRFRPPASRTWKGVLGEAAPVLERALAGIGRVEVAGHPRADHLGTAWFVGPEALVTCRHVAIEFARRDGEGVVFREAMAGGPMGVTVDTAAEHRAAAPRPHRVVEVAWIAEDTREAPDLAVLRVAPGDTPPPVLRLADTAASAERPFAACGHPGFDDRRNDVLEMVRMFDGVFGVKRISPGRLLEAGELVSTHDCTTLGGSSGSPLLDLATGDVVGVHFGGRYAEANWMVPLERLRAVTAPFRT